MSSAGPFSKRMLILIGGVAVGSLVLGIALAVFGSKVTRAPISDANSFSRSAVGHKAFVHLLEKLDIPVVVSQFDSAKKASEGALLILAEPRPFREDITRASALIAKTSSVLLILPKWGSRPMPKRKEWIGAAGLLPAADVERVGEDVLGIELDLFRNDRVAAWSINELGAKPELRHVQLFTSESVEPIVGTSAGILLGRVTTFDGREVWVLADPDIIATHALGKGENAQLAVAMVERLRGDGGAVVFDETIHGFLKKPSVYRALIEFPLVVVTLQMLCAMVLLLWAAVGRFGAPQTPEPAIEPGKRFLINNTAALLQYGGHTAHALQRYYNSTVRDVGRRLHSPDVNDTELEAWLERIGHNKGVQTRLADVRHAIAAAVAAKRVQPRAVVLAANRLYYWKQEMLHGSASNPRSR